MFSLSITISPNHEYVGVTGFNLEVWFYCFQFLRQKGTMLITFAAGMQEIRRTWSTKVMTGASNSANGSQDPHFRWSSSKSYFPKSFYQRSFSLICFITPFTSPFTELLNRIIDWWLTLEVKCPKTAVTVKLAPLPFPSGGARLYKKS